MSKADLTTGRVLALLLAVVLGAACTNNSLDDGGSGDVVLEVENLENPPVSAARAPGGTSCVFTVEDWTFAARNRPKNVSAGGETPFNDISLLDVTVNYAWIDPGLSTPTRVIGLGGVVVPAGDTASVTFPPIAFDDLTAGHQGHTASLTLTFHAVTVEGTRIDSQVTRPLSVESCI